MKSACQFPQALPQTRALHARGGAQEEREARGRATAIEDWVLRPAEGGALRRSRSSGCRHSQSSSPLVEILEVRTHREPYSLWGRTHSRGRMLEEEMAASV